MNRRGPRVNSSSSPPPNPNTHTLTHGHKKTHKTTQHNEGARAYRGVGDEEVEEAVHDGHGGEARQLHLLRLRLWEVCVCVCVVVGFFYILK
jgi:hypothetical protein